MNRRNLIRLSLLALVAAVFSPPETERERKTRLIREAISTPEGRRKLAESMARGYKEDRARGAELDRVRKAARAQYVETQRSWDRSSRHLDRLGLWEYREDLSRWVLIPINRIIEEGAKGIA